MPRLSARSLHDFLAKFTKRGTNRAKTFPHGRPCLPTLADEKAADIYGRIESTTVDGVITGWVHPDRKHASVIAYLDGKEISRTTPDLKREDSSEGNGFTLIVPLPYEVLNESLFHGRLYLNAEDSSGLFKITLGSFLYKSLLSEFVMGEIPNLGPEDARRILGKIHDNALFAGTDFQTFKVHPDAPQDEMTQVTMPVGLVSFDEVSIIGKNGFVFLLAGSNKIYTQYNISERNPNIVHKIDSWTKIISNRNNNISKISKYFQLIIPEKSSFLNEFFPIPIGNMTTLMKGLNKRITSDRALSASYIDATETLNRVRDRAFLKLDTHLTPIGAYEIVCEILQRAGLTMIPVEFNDTIHLAGDVGRRLLSPHAREAMAVPSGERIAALGEQIRLTFNWTPQGSHASGHIVTVNDGALYKMKVIAFGDSNLNYGNIPNQLTWWFSRVFSEYHFRWLPHIDFAYVEEHKPDLVIGQTIERFLVHVPES